MSLPVHLVRRLGALLTAIVGIMNVVSALLPAIPSRLELVQDVLPLYLIRSTQTATVLAGFVLILLAEGLRRRRRRAMQITIALLMLSSILHLAKGLDFEESCVAILLAAGILIHRHAFTVASPLPVPHRYLPQIGAVGLLFYAYVLTGFLVLHPGITPTPTVLTAGLEPYRVLWDAPAFHYLTPQARWFERSFALIGSLAALYAVILLLRPYLPRRRPTPSELSRIRAIVHEHGSDTLSYFNFQLGRRYFFDRSGTAFLSYRLWRTVAIVGGHPVGPPERIPDLVTSFIEFTTDNGIEPCFLGIPSDDLALYSRLGLRTLKVGEEALIDLPDFDATGLKRKVRRAARHIEESNIRAATYRRDTLPADLAAQMDAIHRDWIAERGGSERGFSMTLGRLPGPGDPDCEITLALEGNRVWGFLCLVPAFCAGAWSLDAMRRRDDAPNGLMEFLIIRTAEHYRDHGYQTLSLNFATLSNTQDDIESVALDSTRRFLYEHLSSFYQLRSLEQFNDKFLPRWHSRYLAYRDVRKIPRLALAIVQAEDPIKLPSPMSFFLR